MGLNAEHSWADAPIVGHLWEVSVSFKKKKKVENNIIWPSEDHWVCLQSPAFIELMRTYEPLSVLSIFGFTQQPQIFF